MEQKCSFVCTLVLLLLLLIGPGCLAGRFHAKKNMGSEVYDIDYRGPETHTYIPPPNRAGPRIPHHASTARRKSKRNARRNLFRKDSKS